MTATVFINCGPDGVGGGIGNRFGAIIGGMQAARALKFNAVFYWAPHDHCLADIDDLCSATPIERIHRPPSPKLPLISSHERQPGRPWLPRERALEMTGDFEYATHQYDAPAREIMARFTIHPDIQNHVNDFATRHGIDKSWTGVHVRGTDARRKKRNIDEAKKTIKRASKVFLCSDDPEIEFRFASLPNVLTHPKKHSVSKKTETESWREKRGHITNVHRSREATIEGFQDLLIFSRTTFKCPGSTFCKLAKSL